MKQEGTVQPWGHGAVGCVLYTFSVHSVCSVPGIAPGTASGTGQTTVNRRDPVPALKGHIVYSGEGKGRGLEGTVTLLGAPETTGSDHYN